MLTMLRHLLAILLLPFMVLVVIPRWLLDGFTAGGSFWAEGAPLIWLARFVGGLFLLAGFALFSWCISLFARVGQGTLAPWDPTHNLVAVGPYQFVRNPMISGVLFMLLGEALLWSSWRIGLWAVLLGLINHLYFVLIEEPGLEDRFGEPYRRYKA